MNTNSALSAVLLAGLAAATVGSARAGGSYSFVGPHRSASASWSGGHGGRCCYGGVGVGVGAAAGLAVGTAVGVAAASRPAYAVPPVAFPAPPVVYAGPPPVVYLPPITVIR